MAAVLSQIHPVLPSQDVSNSIGFYERLGFRTLFQDLRDAPTYAGISRDQIEIHIQWHDPKKLE